MSGFDRDALRKGTKAIEETLESRGNGEFRPFLPNLYWKDDKDYRYLLFLNPIEEVPEVELHPYIDAEDGIPHMIMARTDTSIGERSDPINAQWNYKIRTTDLAIAVELVPAMKVVNGREKPVGFEVATREFERKIFEDDEDTGETEEVSVPVIGLVAQSPFNFFNLLVSFDANDGPIDQTPMKITRVGKKDVAYAITGYDLEVDRTNLMEYIENLSYLGEGANELFDEIADLDELEASHRIGEYILYKRIEELADEEEYNTLLGQITKPAKFGDKKDKKDKDKTTRKAKPSQRRTAKVTESVEEEPEAAVTRESPADIRIKELKENTRRRAAAKAKQDTE